jgi:hypothetical protein
MKRQESFNIICKGRTIYKDLTEEEMFDIMGQLALEYYQTGTPNPEELEVELIKTMED